MNVNEKTQRPKDPIGIFLALCVVSSVAIAALVVWMVSEQTPRELPAASQCSQRWAGSGWEARVSGNACVVKINGKEFPEQNIRIETSAYDVEISVE